MEKLSVLLPAYNQGKHIRSNLSEVCSTLDSIYPNYEIILIDDGSTDNTFAEAKRVKSGRVKVVRYTNNHGKGNALKFGFKHSTGDLVCFIDSDLDLHPKQLGAFLSRMRDNGADLVIGSKRHPASVVDYPFQRRLLSAAYSFLNSMLFDLHVSDTQVGFKLFKRSVLEKVLPKVIVKRYAFDLELLVNARKLGFRIAEAPVLLEYKRMGSYVNPMSILNIFVDTLGIAYRLHILGYYD